VRSPRIAALLSLAIVFAIAAAVVRGQSAPQAPPRDELAAEIRALRVELNERLEANIRAQLIIARLQLQEQRTTTVIRQLQDVSDRLRENQQTKQQLEGALKMFSGMAGADSAKNDEGFVMGPLKAQMKQVTELETELKLQQTQLNGALAEEQSRWNVFNARLDDLERALTRK
jgi:hypothetical protein